MNIVNTNYKSIENFILQNEYTWTIEDVLKEYQKKVNGYYVSFTMDEIIKHKKTEIKILLKEIQ